ncbi:hypothetical protein ABIE44_001399 [Marmoricola sp. OAE513]
MASSQPATSANVVFGMSLEISLALDFANCMTRPPPPCTWFIRNRKITTIRMNGISVVSSDPSRLGCGFFTFTPGVSRSWTSLNRSFWLPSIQVATTLSPFFRVACISWSPPSTNVIFLISSFLM